MPRRKLPKVDPAFLAAIREALKSPRILNAQEEAEFHAMRARAGIERGSGLGVALERRGRLVFREEGKAGADLDELPGIRERRRKQRDLEAAEAKALRQPPPPSMGVKARQAAAKILQKRILALADQHVAAGRHRATFIADKLQISPKYVREVIRKRT